MLLNKTRTNASMAFQSLQKITLHTLQDYAVHVVRGQQRRATFDLFQKPNVLMLVCVSAETTVSTAAGGRGSSQSSELENF